MSANKGCFCAALSSKKNYLYAPYRVLLKTSGFLKVKALILVPIMVKFEKMTGALYSFGVSVLALFAPNGLPQAP
jgi:hypothetical protein